MIRFPNQWDAFLKKPFSSPEYDELRQKVCDEYQSRTVFPPEECLFAAFEAVAPADVRAVIIGQDPYHEDGQANGFAFSVRDGISFPPSLRNIFLELCDDIGCGYPKSGDLTPWAKQGVLLMNTVLSVRKGEANSHCNIGWQEFTDSVVDSLAALPQPVAFILWGAQAAKKRNAALNSTYPRLAVQSAHPSPLSAHRGFFGSRPFSGVNEWLRANGSHDIDWRLP